MYRTILVAVDGSDHSVRALQQGERLAKAFDARLVLVHAFQVADIAGHSDYSIQLERRKEHGQGVLDAARAAVEDASRLEAAVLKAGQAAESILEVADEHEADLMVVGSRGLGALEGVLLGSVSLRVAQNAKCAVMIAR